VRVKSDDAVTVGRPSAQVSVPLHWSPAHTGAFLIQFLIDELEKQLDQIDEKERGIKAKLATLQDRHPDDSDLQQAQEALQGLQKWKSMAYEHYRGLVGQAIQGGIRDKEQPMCTDCIKCTVACICRSACEIRQGEANGQVARDALLVQGTLNAAYSARRDSRMELRLCGFYADRQRTFMLTRAHSRLIKSNDVCALHQKYKQTLKT